MAKISFSFLSHHLLAFPFVKGFEEVLVWVGLAKISFAKDLVNLKKQSFY